eukprot:2442764-Pyramimonas_sp.AAC.1
MMWEVLDQGVIPNKELRQLLDATAREFYPANEEHPDHGWDFALQAWREAQERAQDAYNTWAAYLPGSEPPLNIKKDTPRELPLYRGLSDSSLAGLTGGGNFAKIQFSPVTHRARVPNDCQAVDPFSQ